MQEGFLVKMTQEHGPLFVIPPTHGMRDISLEVEVRMYSNPINAELFLFADSVQQQENWLPQFPSPAVKAGAWPHFEPKPCCPNRNFTVAASDF